MAELGLTDVDLTTDDPRLPAIKTYLKLGFLAYETDPSHPARWDMVEEKLGCEIGRISD